MRWRQCHRWSFTARLIPGARQRCAVPDYLFAESCGSRCSAQAWKKESLGLGLLLQQPCVHSTPNIWPDCGRPPRQSTDYRTSGARRLDISKVGRESPQQVCHNRCYIVTRTKGELGKESREGRTVDESGTTEADTFENVEVQTEQRKDRANVTRHRRVEWRMMTKPPSLNQHTASCFRR